MREVQEKLEAGGDCLSSLYLHSWLTRADVEHFGIANFKPDLSEPQTSALLEARCR